MASTTPNSAPEAASESAAPLVTKPEEGTPALVDSIQGLLEWCAKVVPGEHLSIDVERASSYRYSARAYLVQIKTPSAGIILFDPLAFTLPARFIDLMNSQPWILHASRQDLPSLAMLGLYPSELFDTEVAARLLGLERVGLGYLTESLLNVRLAKEHSAANWSKRPLPEAWLEYAALDVEYLEQLKNILQTMLREAGKNEWARQEFTFESTFSELQVPEEPWRSLHGIGQLRHPKQLAVARALWEHRDQIAQRSDIAPFLVLRDKVMVTLAKTASQGRNTFNRAMPREMKNRDQWWKVARSALELSPAHLPSISQKAPYPHHRTWSRKFSHVQDAYQKLREALIERSEQLKMPVENVMSPGHVRHWVWNTWNAHSGVSSLNLDAAQVEKELIDVGARPWQAAIVAPLAVSVFA